MARIASLGSALEDIYLIDRDDFTASTIGDTSIFGKIEIGTKVDIDRVTYGVGGGGTNTSVTFARTGHESIFLGSIGHDPAGEAILACLDREGIDTSYISYSRRATGISVILLDAHTGERTILTHRGASSTFDRLNPSTLDTIRPDWLYITTLRGDMDTLESFIMKARSLGVKIMFNPGILEIENLDRLLSLLPNIDILLTNKLEAARIVPGRILGELVSHLGNYVNTVIITDSKNGGIAKSGSEVYRFGLYEDLPAKDSTGAGDAFGSGFLSAFAAGRSLKESLTFASANSTSVISHIGAHEGILSHSKKIHQMPISKV